MNERELAISVVMKLLKTKETSIELEKLAGGLNAPSKVLLGVISQLEEGDIATRTQDGSAIVVPNGEGRLKLAIAATTLGARIEESASALTWKEFEAFCTRVLEENGYLCMHEFRFKSANGRRYECDIVAINRPMIILADCKHYGGRVSGLRGVVKKQSERAISASKSISTLIRRIPKIVEWGTAVMIPMIITLFPENIAMIDDVPIVPAFKLNWFLQELPSNIERIAKIEVKPSDQRRLIQNSGID